MRFKEFKITGLFGLYNHEIKFSQTKENVPEASVVMLYGANGVGKTTLLKMIDGLMTLNFDVFREIKFRECRLKFSNNSVVKVIGVYEKNTLMYLDVSYNNNKVKLNPNQSGGINPAEEEKQILFIEAFNKGIDKFSFEFIDTERLVRQSMRNDETRIDPRIFKQKIHTKRNPVETMFLANKVKDFLTKSQVYYERYFSKSEPELFEKLIENIELSNSDSLKAINLIDRINSIKKLDRKYQTTRLGIAKDKWDEKKLIGILEGISNKDSYGVIQKLTVINSYVEVLESRLNERKDLAERLLIFEDLLNKFLIDKKFSISPETGFRIISNNGDDIKENQLSTGEYHLLYLTVLALCTKVQGSIIAIDEPEMSMHISWQRKLVQALIQCSSKANPQFIFATHSPDIASKYDNSLITTKYV